MAYYDTIQSEALFVKHALKTRAQSFDSLYQPEDFESGVSRWNTPHLYASRVICANAQDRLALFDDGDFPRSARGVHDCIDRLIDGPAAGYIDQYEPQIVQQQQNQPDSLGYTWAALSRLLQADRAIAAKSDRPRRQKNPVIHAGFIPSGSIQVGSSSPVGSTSGSSVASLAFVNRMSSAPLENLTVRLASCFIRCVLNYAQPIDKAFPIHFRDEHLVRRFTNAPNQRVEAVDDGGMQLYHNGRYFQVAVLEGKRSFQQFKREGMPTVSDGTLGQLVGQALARFRDRKIKTVGRNDHLTILAVTHCVKFFHFHATDGFINKYEEGPLTSPTTDYLRVSSTEWFNLDERAARKGVVKHLLALLAWAERQRDSCETAASDSSDDGDSDDSDESMSM